MFTADTLGRPERTEAEGRHDLALAQSRVLPLKRGPRPAEAMLGDNMRSEQEARAECERRATSNLKVISASQIHDATELARRYGEPFVRAAAIVSLIAAALERIGRDRALEIAAAHFYLCQAKELISVLERSMPAEASFGDECGCAGCRS